MPRVALIKGDDRYQNLLRAFNMIHEDIDRSEIEGKQVLLKPNLVSVSKPLAVTHGGARVIRGNHPDASQAGENDALPHIGVTHQ